MFLLYNGERPGIFSKTLGSDSPVRRDYSPSAWEDADYKIFTAGDASNFADALEKGIAWMNENQLTGFGKPGPMLITDSIDPNYHNEINTGINEKFLKKLIVFLRRGEPFKVFWDSD